LTISHLDITIITKKEETATEQAKGKLRLELFFNSSGIVHMKFISEEVTVNKQTNKETLHCVRSPVRHKHPELWHKKDWLLLHSSAPAHCSVLVEEELEE
jgi:stress response protein YsnF